MALCGGVMIGIMVQNSLCLMEMVKTPCDCGNSKTSSQDLSSEEKNAEDQVILYNLRQKEIFIKRPTHNERGRFFCIIKSIKY